MRLLRFKVRRRSYFALFPISFAVVLLVWCVLSYTGAVAPFFLPSPGTVVASAFKLFGSHEYISDVAASLNRVFWGFVLSAVLGVPLGLAIGVNKYAEAAIEPFIDFVRYMPVAGFVPLCILWLGIGDTQKVAVIFIGTFFQLVPMVMSATASVPEEFLDTARTLGAKDMFVLRKVILPHTMPAIYEALRISVGIAWTYLVVAEIVAASSGVGHVIIEAQRYLKTANIFVGILTIGLLGLFTDYLFKLTHPWLFPWMRRSAESA